MTHRRLGALVLVSALLAVGSVRAEPLDEDALRERARAIFGTLPDSAPREGDSANAARIDLGRMLYYDARLSKNHDVSCNTCHLLDQFGVDGLATSTGHRGQKGARNAPTVYNAAIHVAQFWDGRAADVEAQAEGPPLNPIEMAMPSKQAVMAVIDSMPAYRDHFKDAFPSEVQPVRFDNMARAIGAFERKLMTPAPFDEYLAGTDGAIGEEAKRGLDTFIMSGCVTCHMGPAIGGSLFQKIGLVHPYATSDLGRFDVTGQDSDRYVFKVPSLRNVAKTAPYFHDGGIEKLEQAVRLMGYHQLGLELDAETIADILAFLDALTGQPPSDYVAQPVLPASTQETPKPDPS